jgi:transposase-like protein
MTEDTGLQIAPVDMDSMRMAITAMFDNEEEQNCAYVVFLSNNVYSGRRHSMEEIARILDVHRTTLYRWKREWTDSGLLQRVSNRLAAHIKAEYEYAQLYALSRFGEMVQRMVEIVLDPEGSAYNAVNAYSALHKTVVEPAVLGAHDASAIEDAYLKGLKQFRDRESE